mgnify:CR=1 FL=1
MAFRWLLNDHEYVPHPELLLVREAVVKVSSRVIGVMSGIRLADVTSVFVQKMEERVSARKDPAPRADANLLRTQALKLCAGEGAGFGPHRSEAAMSGCRNPCLTQWLSLHIQHLGRSCGGGCLWRPYAR